MAKFTNEAKYTEDEKQVRKRLIDRSLTQSQIARALGLTRQDVSNVICGICRSPRYVKMVYDFVELEVPEDYGLKKRSNISKKEPSKPPEEIAS